MSSRTMTDLDQIHEELKSHKLEDSVNFSRMEHRFDGIDEKLSGLATKEDMESIKPLLEAIAGGKTAVHVGRIAYRIFFAIGGLAMGWIAIRQTFHI